MHINTKIIKKSTLFFLFTYFSFLTIQAQSIIPHNQFDFSGKIIGQTDGYVFLNYKNENGKYVKDSCKLKGGAFKFQGYMDEPTEAYFWGNRKSHSVNDPNFVIFFLEPGIVKAIFKVTHFKQGKITGSQTQTEYELLNRNRNKVAIPWDSIKKDYKEAKRKKETLKVNKLQKKLNQYRAAYYKVYYDFINNHPGSYVSASILFMLQGGHLTLDSVKMFYNRLTPQVQQSTDGRAILESIKRSESVAIGKTALDFVQPDMKGKLVSLESFRGKYVLLDFWASWCVPCRQEDPYLVKAYKKYKNNNFTIISISLDTDAKKWKEAVKQDNLFWTQLSDLKGRQNAAAKKYNVIPIPDNFLIDPDGKIIARGLRGEKLLDKLDKIFQTQTFKHSSTGTLERGTEQ